MEKLPFLAGATLVVGAMTLTVRAALAAHLLWEGASASAVWIAMASLGAAGSAALLVALNTLAHPRGLSPGWVLVLVAPFLYAQAVIPMLAAGPTVPQGPWVGTVIASVTGAAAGAVAFLALFAVFREEGWRARAAAVAVAAAVAFQALAAVASAGSDPAQLTWMLSADGLTALALYLALLWGVGMPSSRRATPVVTLRPGR